MFKGLFLILFVPLHPETVDAMKLLATLILILSCLSVHVWGYPADKVNETAVPSETPDGTFLLQGTSQPVVGSKLYVSYSKGEMSQFTFKWTRGDVHGNFDKNNILSSQPDYTISDKDIEHWLRVSISNQSGKTVFTKDTWISKLPVLYIDTDNGEPVTTKEYYLTASLRIQGNAEYEQQYLGTAQIKGRGNSSWRQYPQKPYKLKLDKKKKLFGFGKSKHWALVSNFNDKCALRNYTASCLAKQLGIIGMDMTWVDVVLNGEVKGCYMLSQHVRVDESSVNIFDWEGEAETIANALLNAIIEEEDWNVVTGKDQEEIEETMKSNMAWVSDGLVTFRGKTYDLSAYELKKDYNIAQGYLYEATQNNNSTTQFTTPGGVHFKVDTPEYLCTNTEMMTFASNFWCDFEAEYSREPPPEGKNFAKFANMESMVAIWLVNEIMGQGDPTNSRFSYLDNDGVLNFGPAWDFDHSSACWTTSSSTTTFCTFTHDLDHIYFRKWFPDPVLCQMAYDAYWDVARPFLTDYLSDGGEMSARFKASADAGKTNDILWGDYPSQLLPSAQPRTAKEDYERFRTFLLGHLEWLDEQFQSVETLIDEMNDRCEYPFEEAKRAIKLIQDDRLIIEWGAKRYTINGKRIK